MSKWIKVSERMPDLGMTKVLVCRGGDIAMPVFFDGEDFICVDFGMNQKYQDAKYWMELPEGPDEE